MLDIRGLAKPEGRPILRPGKFSWKQEEFKPELL
jgi:hypothetical protein